MTALFEYDMGIYLTGSDKDTAYKEGSEAYKKELETDN